MILELKIPQSAFDRLGPRCDRAHAAGLARVAVQVQAVAVRKAGDIRKRRIPSRREVAAYNQRKYVRKTSRAPRTITASSDPAWKATGDLLKSVQATPIFQKNSVLLTADVPYSGDRHALGVSRQPAAPALGIVRRDPFFADAEAVTAPQIGPLYIDGYQADWERGR